MKRKIALFIILALVALLLLTACSGAKFGVHKVTFDADGGDLSFWDKSTNVQTYGTVDLPTPTKEGYVFEGWFIGEGVNEAQFTATSMVTSDITLKAKWRKAEYTVTFLDYYGNAISRETVKYGDSANAPVVPRIAEEKLRFDSWDTDFTVITGDLEVKALYAIDSYTITYVTNNSQTIPATSYFFDETPKVPPTPGLGGHHFIGWYLDEEFTTEYLFDKPLTSDITLYAYFNESIPISTIEELFAIEQYTTNSYFLKNDIDCEGAVLTGSILDFAGSFDGEGHRIYNFVYQPVAAANSGIFATNGGTIKNITFADFSYTLNNQNINGSNGFLVGTNNGTVENIHLTNASLSYTHTSTGGSNYQATYSYSSTFGGLIGKNSGNVVDCSFVNSTLYLKAYTSSWYDSGVAKATFDGAALIGKNESNGNIKNCNIDIDITLRSQNDGTSSYSGNKSYFGFGILSAYNEGKINDCNVKAEANASANENRTREFYFGGLVYKNLGEINQNSVDLSITCSGIFSYISVAGFVENNIGTINNSYANVNISNTDSNAISGGFASYNTGGIYKCYTTGKMNVGAATAGKGGFAGYNNGNINSCFADVNITATDNTNFGAIVGKADTASYITNSYYSIKAIFTTNGEPQVFDLTHAEPIDPLSLTDKEFVVGTLGWSEDVWSFDENKFNYPTLK